MMVILIFLILVLRLRVIFIVFLIVVVVTQEIVVIFHFLSVLKHNVVLGVFLGHDHQATPTSVACILIWLLQKLFLDALQQYSSI
jgi:hypothetical protein